MIIHKRVSYVSVRVDKLPVRQLQPRIYLSYRPLSRLSMDLKVIPRSQKSHKFILCVTDEVTNYLITVPIYHAKSEEVGEALIENIIAKYCIPDCIIMDQDSAFMSSLMNYLFRKFEISQNHRSMQPSIFASRAWYKIIVDYINETPDRKNRCGINTCP